MGSDIQIFLEFLLPNGTWVADEYHRKSDNEADRDPEMGLPAEWRDYDLFAALAGVRGEGPKPKGLPNDLSPHIKALDAMGSANEDHSVLNFEHFTQEEYSRFLKVQNVHPSFTQNSPERKNDKADLDYRSVVDECFSFYMRSTFSVLSFL